MMRSVRLVPAALVAALSLSLAAPAFASGWATTVPAATQAVAALQIGGAVPLDLLDGYPDWLGTAFQMRLPSGREVDVTAGHMAAYENTKGQWMAWSQVTVAPLGTSGMLHPSAFDATDLRLWANADVAEMQGTVQRRLTHMVTWQAQWGRDPAIRGALPLGDWQAVAQGQQLLVIGNPGGDWQQNGDRPTLAYATYLGAGNNVLESGDGTPNGWPGADLPTVMVLYGTFHPGDSGSPVVNEAGQVVGVFVAVDTANGEGYAIPLDPTTGAPVGGVLTRIAG